MEFDLELGLLPSSASLSTTQSSNGGKSSKQEQMTIFYNGRICVCDVTQDQARSIISLASRYKSTEGMMCRSQYTGGDDANHSISQTLQSQRLCAQNGTQSMKRSLRQFLEKRKHRAQSTFPYHRTP
ncbi:protein TIFY 5A-like [Amaranthus tricolor]|uniref:protein TIFY 5A-like n=1 Tax=Amaranthus tricolor TaxID=29722 RepID=UPI00258C7632|nr:protein TIFY 5A-like [Amaranthus tricolor]